MPGPSIMVRILGEATGLATSFETISGKAKSVGSTMHDAFRGGLDTLNQTGVLGPFGQALATADDQLQKVKGHGKEVGPAMAASGAAVAGLGLALTAMGSKDQAAHQQLQAAVEATGHSYDQYGSKVDAAIKHQEKFGTTADVTQDALRTLTTATNDPAKALQLLNTASDLAAAKHISLADAAGKLGKAYNGNTRVFKEFGIQVDSTKAATSELSKANSEVQKSGDEMAKAQQKLADVHAELAGKTTLTAGEQIKLRDAQQAVDKASGDQAKAQADLKKAHSDVAAATNANGKAIDQLGTKLKGQAAASADTFSGKLKGIKAAATDTINQFGQKFGPALTGAGLAMSGLGTALTVGNKAVRALGDSQKVTAAATKIWTGAQAALNVVMDANVIVLIVLAIAALVAVIILAYTHSKTFRDIVADMGKVAMDVFNGIKTVALDAFHFIANNWPLLLGILFGPFGLAVAIIATHFNTVKALASSVISHITGAFSTVVGIITAPFAAAVRGVSDAIGGIIGTVAGIPKRITDALSGATNILYNIGKDIINGLGRGIEDAGKAVLDKAKSLADSVGNTIKGALHIGSPSRVTQAQGVAIAQGLGVGITQGYGQYVAPTLANTIRGLTAAGGSSAPVTTPAASAQRGPAVVVQNLTVADPMDVDAFMRRVSWEAQRMGV